MRSIPCRMRGCLVSIYCYPRGFLFRRCECWKLEVCHFRQRKFSKIKRKKMYQHLSTKTWDKGKARLCDIRFVWEVLSGILCTLRPRLSGYHVWYLLINIHRALNHSIEDQDCTLQCLWAQGEGCVTSRPLPVHYYWWTFYIRLALLKST